ncbi:glycoside hydrolase family 3 N-terminal domain-containing protein [Patulibacter defluvii]|uniref:glycoside hydrolase family 3 N-terminal domain-containing protein n=1 Tax=Patulibacter defluvii TaxID=3095358 RepID=UPI002A7530BA|nr:glycoside hydrolase family 3 N-terminal domain-containing protein [Patulibacter sp. DM4]
MPAPPTAASDRDRERRTARAERQRAARRRRQWLLAALAAVAVLVLLVVLIGSGGGDDGPNGSRSAAAKGTAAERLAAELDDDELAGQRVIAPFRQTGATVPPALRKAIADGHVGGVILFAENARRLRQARALTRRLQALPRPEALRRTPLLVLTDQEGGQVRRLVDAPPRASASEQGAGGPTVVRRAGRDSARALCAAGINVNLAPVADLGGDGFIAAQDRTYGDDPETVSTLAAAFLAGARGGGIASTAKHFPGLGRARRNTDEGRARIEAEASALRARDLAPFRRLIDGGVELVMLANAIYPAYGPAPAVLAPKLVRDELRGRLGFRGVTISDDLQAGAFSAVRSPEQLAVTAARAGIDLLLYGTRTDGALVAARALRKALDDGGLARDEARAATARVLDLRQRLARRCR